MKHKPRRVVPSSWLSPVTGVGVAISRVTIRISLLFTFLKWMKKIVHVLRKISFSSVHVPLFKCCYPQNWDGRMCVSMSVIPVNSLVHKADFVYLPDGEVEQPKDTLPHSSMHLNIAFLASLIV